VRVLSPLCSGPLLSRPPHPTATRPACPRASSPRPQGDDAFWDSAAGAPKPEHRALYDVLPAGQRSLDQLGSTLFVVATKARQPAQRTPWQVYAFQRPAEAVFRWAGAAALRPEGPAAAGWARAWAGLGGLGRGSWLRTYVEGAPPPPPPRAAAAPASRGYPACDQQPELCES
jgi:hypothetical protein